MSLQKMIDKQIALQERLNCNPVNMPLKERVAFIKEHSIHATQEIHEMLYELPFFKPWKTYVSEEVYGYDAELALAREEFVDAMHFMLNMGIALGFTTEEDLVAAYLDKNAVNHKRQDEGY